MCNKAGSVCVCVYTIFGGDIADDVNFVHGNLPMGFLLTETQSSAFQSVAGVALDTQEDRPLETQDTLLRYTLAKYARQPGVWCQRLRLCVSNSAGSRSQGSLRIFMFFYPPSKETAGGAIMPTCHYTTIHLVLCTISPHGRDVMVTCCSPRCDLHHIWLPWCLLGVTQ